MDGRCYCVWLCQLSNFNIVIIGTSIRHVILHRGGVHFAVLETVGVHGRSDWFLPSEGSFALGSLAADLSVHGEGSPFPHGWRFSTFARFQQFNGGFGCQTLVVIIVELDHWRVGTSAQTLHLQQSEEAVLGGLAILDTQMLLNGLFDVLRTTNHAGCGAAELDKVLTHLGPIEHGVEGCDLIDTGRSGSNNLSHLVHCGHRQPTTVLTLGQIQQRNNTRLLVIGRILG
mmetsp:Transcript_8566/g.14508  ORF Transcript_8566/g.14508 Transcript_8566/m.14508 type:complete len:229 (-) Transcript_8566:200-886(-)